MRVQDINGHWYEVDDALLAKCEVKLDRESAPAESPAATTIAVSPQHEIRSRTPAAGSTLAEGSVDSSAC
jgi:hypothetical protein